MRNPKKKRKKLNSYATSQYESEKKNKSTSKSSMEPSSLCRSSFHIVPCSITTNQFPSPLDLQVILLKLIPLLKINSPLPWFSSCFMEFSEHDSLFMVVANGVSIGLVPISFHFGVFLSSEIKMVFCRTPVDSSSDLVSRTRKVFLCGYDFLMSNGKLGSLLFLVGHSHQIFPLLAGIVISISLKYLPVGNFLCLTLDNFPSSLFSLLLDTILLSNIAPESILQSCVKFKESSMAQAKEPRSHQKSKHILRKFHLIREFVDRGEIEICRVESDANVADPLTKPLMQPKFERHRAAIGLRCMSEWS